jgi:hypothetical protein
MLLMLLFSSASAWAKNWQIMLIPQAAVTEEQAVLQAQYASVIEQAIAYQLLQNLEQVISAKGVFGDCNSPLCGSGSLQLTLQEIQAQAPEVELVLLYGLKTGSEAMLSIELIDPLSLEYYDSFNLPLLNASESTISLAQIRSLSSDLGKVVAQRLKKVIKNNRFKLVLNGFSLDEVAPFASYVLSESPQSELRLSKSEKVESWMSDYLPVMETRFVVTTGATESQFNHLLNRFFEQSNIDVVNEFDAENQQFVVSRLGNPYTPSLLSRFLMVMMFILLCVLLIKRQIFQYQLERYAQRKSVDQWLEVYAKARSPWFALRSKWGNQFSYWQRLQRESQDLEKQAKLFFDAGDMTSAKLFISKSLNLNTDAKLARSLVQRIEQQESNHKALSEKEQWVRNKVAKAMNNYRGNQPIKALRQSYQALAALQDEKKLKRQYKAIKRLINKINADFTRSVSHLELSDLQTNDSCLVSNAAQLEIGRFSSKDITLAHLEDVIPFYINHKALSRAGKHLAIQRTENGFYMFDQNSTNGSFVHSVNGDNTPLKKGQLRAVVDRDEINLGADSDLSAVKLLASVDESHSLLHLRMSKQLTKTLDIADLARVWPDYMHAMRSSLVMTSSYFVLAVNASTQALSIISLAQSQQNNDYKGMVVIELGKSAKLSPYQPAQDEDAILYNDEPLLGEVPLLLPCELKWAEHHIYMDEYTAIDSHRPASSLHGQNDRRFYLQRNNGLTES